MTQQEIISSIQELMRNFFKNDALTISMATSANDIDDWDSLNHMTLISEIEKKFNVQFEFFEIMNFENIGELVNSIQTKL